MPNTVIVGGGTIADGANPGVPQAVDPTFLAARIAMRPLDYATKGRVLGHYSTFQRSGEIAATLGATGALASIRWPDQSLTGGSFAVLLGCRIGLSVSATVTAGTIEQAYAAWAIKGFTVDYTASNTRLAMSAVPKTNAMRSNMSSSLMGAAGPAICTTAVMTGITGTLDANPFAGVVMPPLLTATNATGTAVLLPAGTQSPMMDLYKFNPAYEHPLVLSSNEGVVIRNLLAGYATGTFALYTEWKWAEVEVF